MPRLLRVSTILALGVSVATTPGPTQSASQSRAVRKAQTIVSLANRVVDAGLPEEYPLHLAKEIPEHRLREYKETTNKEVWRGFYAYRIFERQDPELSSDLKKFWRRNSYRELRAAIPELVPFYLAAEDFRVRRIYADLIMDALQEGSQRTMDLSAFSDPVMTIVESEVRPDIKIMLLRSGLRYAFEDGNPDITQRLLKFIDRERTDCEVVRYAMWPLNNLARQPDYRSLLIDRSLELIGSGVCPETIKLALVASGSNLRFENSKKLRWAFASWLREDLEGSAGELTRQLLRHYVIVEPTPAVIPYLVKTLDVEDGRTRCRAVPWLENLTRSNKKELPYDFVAASDYWEDAVNTRKGREDPRWLEGHKEVFHREHAKALAYWKAWWKENQRRYTESLPGTDAGFTSDPLPSPDSVADAYSDS